MFDVQTLLSVQEQNVAQSGKESLRLYERFDCARPDVASFVVEGTHEELVVSCLSASGASIKLAHFENRFVQGQNFSGRLKILGQSVQVSGEIVHLKGDNAGVKFWYDRAEFLDFIRPRNHFLQCGLELGGQVSESISSSELDAVEAMEEVPVKAEMILGRDSYFRLTFGDYKVQYAVEMKAGNLLTFKNYGHGGEICYFMRNDAMDMSILNKTGLILIGYLSSGANKAVEKVLDEILSHLDLNSKKGLPQSA